MSKLNVFAYSSDRVPIQSLTVPSRLLASVKVSSFSLRQRRPTRLDTSKPFFQRATVEIPAATFWSPS